MPTTIHKPRLMITNETYHHQIKQPQGHISIIAGKQCSFINLV